MKRDILLCGVTAVAIHALVFSAPLLKAGNNTRAYIYEPISISIIRHQESVDGVSSIKPKAPSREQSHVPARQTVISKKKVTTRKHVTAKNAKAVQSSHEATKKVEPAVNRDIGAESLQASSFDRVTKDQHEKIGSRPGAKIASTAGNVPKIGQKSIGSPKGDKKALDKIVYAMPRYKENPLPVYPEVARRRGYEGKILLRVKVLANGEPEEIEIEQSSGFNVLDTAALKSVKDWMFVPGEVNGKKTEQWINVPIRFVLK